MGKVILYAIKNKKQKEINLYFTILLFDKYCAKK